MSDPETRNPTYQRLRAPARQGTYTIGQLIALAVSGLLAVGLAGLLIRIGTPVGVSLTGGILLAGSVPMAALALEGREFSVLGFARAAITWQRSPRRFAAAPGAPPAHGYHVSEAPAAPVHPLRRVRQAVR